MAPDAAAVAAVPFEYKGVGARFGATLIDGVLVSIAAGLLYMGLLSIDSLADVISSFESTDSAVMVELAFLGVLGFLYYVLFEGWFGGTLGKLILGMRVVNKSGKRVGLARAFFRNLLRIIDILAFAYLPGIILVARSKTKQHVADRIAGTYVVARKSLAGR